MVVRILRGLIDVEELPLTLITETNVPHAENVSYFGEANEAHLVYQFSLAPLLLYSYIAGDSRALVEWTRSLAAPPAGCSYFNFIASHDGIGLRPLEGLLPDSEIAHLIDIVHERGGFASMRSADSGQERAYELNISLFSAFGGDPEDLNAYVGAHQLLLAYQGVPGLYLNALLGTANDYQQMEITGRMRSINRGHWQLHDATAALQDTDSHHAKVFHALTSSMQLRGEQSAFAPAAAQTFIDGSNEHLMFLRHDKYQRILVIASFAPRSQTLAWPEGVLEPYQAVVKDLLSARTVDCSTAINVDPYQVMWLELA
jgi:sucrose phosphorylase